MADGNQLLGRVETLFSRIPQKEEEDNIKKKGLVDKITSFFGRSYGEGRGEGSRSESSSVSHESSTKSYDPREMLSSDSLSSRSSSSDGSSHEPIVGAPYN